MMNLSKPVRSQIRMDSFWMNLSVISMGLCIFLRAVYYLGLINFKDLDPIQLITGFILPVVIASVYLILVKGLNMNSPIVLCALFGVLAIDYFFVMDQSESISVIMLLCNVAVLFLTALGIVKDCRFAIAISMISMAYRVIGVDFVGYIFPLTDFKLVSYLPHLSNMFAVIGIGCAGPAIQVLQRRVFAQESSK